VRWAGTVTVILKRPYCTDSRNFPGSLPRKVSYRHSGVKCEVSACINTAATVLRFLRVSILRYCRYLQCLPCNIIGMWYAVIKTSSLGGVSEYSISPVQVQARVCKDTYETERIWDSEGDEQLLFIQPLVL
jgi:hypothetical protein